MCLSIKKNETVQKYKNNLRNRVCYSRENGNLLKLFMSVKRYF